MRHNIPKYMVICMELGKITNEFRHPKIWFCESEKESLEIIRENCDMLAPQKINRKRAYPIFILTWVDEARRYVPIDSNKREILLTKLYHSERRKRKRNVDE